MICPASAATSTTHYHSACIKQSTRANILRTLFPRVHFPQPLSRIDKLAILGVRSFDNTRSETIQFHAPLTLIVGYNGSGKTTIIECLKYATTGDLPPNSKGGAFIHDPKMCGEKEVLAQVKLSFKSTSDAKMVCTRSLQLTVKKTTRQQKTLEGQLLVVRNGERSTISSRCAELDQVMPQYLGVSKAVLEYVIFCHQDESLWPLSEPAVLKKRFDEIFEALKYTKAIDNIKILRKKQNEELGNLKILLEQYRTDKDRGERAKRRSDELHDEIESMRLEVTELSRQISEIVAQQAQLFATAKGFEETIATLNAKKQEARTMETYIDEISQHLTHFEESDAELERMQHEYGKRMNTYQEHIEAKKAKYVEVDRDLDRVRRRLGEKLTEEGRIQAEQTAFEAQLVEREKLIKEISRRHGIRGFDSQLDDSQIREFIDKVSGMSRDQSLTLERIKRENAEEMRGAQEELNEIINKRRSLTGLKDHHQSSGRSVDDTLAALQQELDSIDVNEGQEAILKSQLQDKEHQHATAEQSFRNSSFDGSIRAENSKLRGIEDELESVTTELAKGTKQADERAKLGFLKKELETRRMALETMSVANKEKIDRLIDQPWTASTVESQLQRVLSNRQDELTEATSLRDGVNQELGNIETRINIAKDGIRTKKLEASRCEREVRAAYDAEEQEDIRQYPGVAEEVEKNLTEARTRLEQVGFYKQYFETAVKTLQEHGSCVLCRRNFESALDRKNFQELVTTRLQSVMTANTEDIIRELEEDLKHIKDAAPSFGSWKRLTEIELPKLEADLQKLNQTKELLLEEYNQHEKNATEKAHKKFEAESLRAPVAEIAKYTREISNYEKQVEDASRLLQELGGSRTIEEMQSEMQRLNDGAKVIKRRINVLIAEKETARHSITLLDGQVRDLRMKFGELNFKISKAQDLVKRIESHKQEAVMHTTAIEEIDQKIRELAPKIQRAEAKVQMIQDDGAGKENRHQRDAMKLAESDMQLKRTQHGIGNYLNRGGPEQLNRCRHQVQTLQVEVKKHEAEVTSIRVEVNNLEIEEGTATSTERSIHENLRFRKNKRDLEKLNVEIRELEGKNADAERHRFQRNAEVLSDKHMRLSSEKSAKAGEMRSKDKQLEQLIADYQTDYADAKQKYKETLAKVQTTTGATNDLAKYGAALDKAVMRYHSLKMEEINRIIEELWKSTYRGTDVDTILIRSDNENAKGNRSYNYRVCMVKQDAEMDMRGRCSAGQKVLASIIIRLALAECFGINCGLIALDEPTTNLDSDNIRSLAKSLHEIIQTRQAQSNFQLIVITHDEDFLKEMQCQDYCDHYYRVSRNDRQKSIIERQSIAEVI
ncbi:unnamed protein product [Tuber melanosporum]|uniref:DNA repair protein RAD50 n=1 Tax=Tuber melanosporum (strain Mel28) TaxID=656061 RepID=D5G668_TUBMM|nr:uncharacterized protein GSTUM_00001634001 [Tuber melanosporum]CAZ80011.1 unnamed protein product [Tuber melanosporum]